MSTFTEDYRAKLHGAIDTIPLAGVNQAIEILKQARQEDRMVFICGNGGSALTSSHIVCDIVKGASFNREQRFRMICLNDNVATLTAYSNDVSYDCVFVEQLKNFGRAGDVLICVSGSGNSPNVLRAMEYANQAGLKTIGLTGRDGGQLGRLSQLEIRVADPHMGRIEDGHMIILHMIAYYFMEEVKNGASC